MEQIYSQDFFLSAGEADAEKEMALPILVSKIIDIATAHANSLGIGNPDMQDKEEGWVLSRLTIDMKRYPVVNDTYRLSTWVESWNRHFSTRCFRISTPEGEILGYARSVWMVLNTRTRANAGLSHLHLPEGTICAEPCPIEKQARHTKIGEGGIEASVPAVGYRFKYCDLDSYRHVNTVRYVQLLLNQMPLSRYDECRLSRLELSFLHEAHYGMEVRLERRDDPENPLLSSFYLEADDTTPILFARVLFTPREK